AITPRTAGFDTISVNALSSASILLTILLMIMGASSGSTGGGVKVTTIGVLFATMWSHLRGREDVVLWGRAISHTVLIRSISMVLIYLLTLFFGSFILLLIEPFPFRCLVFEVVSALGTVGLSTGITGDLSPAGKLVLIALMFWGRVGLLTFMYSLLKKDHKGSVSYPEATFIVG
ncbi:MAG TPA: potassium transporter TrkG, partial [Thermosynergistes sp.]|nr:potassium transporter TrkG [Thermosynergistes sp.]